MMEIEASGSQGTSGVRNVTRKYLFDRMQSQNSPNLDEKLNSLQQELLSSEKYSDEQISALKHNFSHFKSQIKKKWLQVHKKEDVFLSKYKSWLEGGFELTVAAKPKRCGRPQKHFSDSGERSKRRKTAELRSTVKDKDFIMHAASVELIKSGKRDASKVLKDIQNSPTRATKYKKAFANTGKKERLIIGY
ncbi:PREDICTED: uncharacterized protein LOC108361823 [Rhagoletis zephyria]|uniref:uncharacterized protein LOC108361823 n=1 Tax=Rhagoletis zephyria TaxID=28612 RepID=UPI0008112704|nr:PREDICTED: uncharacterized protein LOC108361823 [Rhagoletis zephyria]